MKEEGEKIKEEKNKKEIHMEISKMKFYRWKMKWGVSTIDEIDDVFLKDVMEEKIKKGNEESSQKLNLWNQFI